MQTKLGQCESGLQRMIAHARERRDGALLERAEELDSLQPFASQDVLVQRFRYRFPLCALTAYAQGLVE